MKEMKALKGAALRLAHTGENEAVRVAFSLAPFEEAFPGGRPALLVRRKGDTQAYPVTLTVEGDTAYWTVTAADTAAAGFGQCELQWYAGDTLAKSDKFDFLVVQALEAGAEPPDEPSKRWFDAIQSQIGDLDGLTTKAKENLVAAINEAAKTGSGGTDISLGVTGAAAGQIAKISAVDENGVPTAWTPADMPSGGGDDGEMGELLLSAEASDVAAFSQSFDTKNYDKFLFFIGGTKASTAISINQGSFFTDGMWFTICYYTGWLDATNTSYPDGCIVQTLERVTDDFASVTYDKVPTALAPIRSTFQGTSSQFASPKRGYLQGVTNETPDGIELQFSGTVSYVKIAVYGYH